MKQLFFSITLLIILSFTSSQTLDIEFSKDKAPLYLHLGVGTPEQGYRMLLDLGSFHMWLGNKTLEKSLGRIFQYKKSSTFEETTNSVVTVNQKGNEVLDLINLGNKVISQDKKFHFLLLNKFEPTARGDGVLGLARLYLGKIKWGKRNVDANPRFSLLQYLYTNQAISTKSFSMRFTTKTKGIISFGATAPSKYPSCMPNEAVNESSTLYAKWNCAYNGVTFTNGTYVFDFVDKGWQTVTFETAFDFIQLPEGPANQFFVAIQSFINVECKKLLIPGRGNTMFCDSSMNAKLVPDFIVKANGMDIKLPGKEFFEPYYDETLDTKGAHGFITKIYGNKYNKSSMRIGNSFLKYYTFVFNSETGSVSMGDFNDIFDYSTKGTPQGRGFRPPQRTSFWTILLIFFLLLIFGFVGYVFYKKKLMRRKHDFNERAKKAPTKETLIEPIGKPMVNK